MSLSLFSNLTKLSVNMTKLLLLQTRWPYFETSSGLQKASHHASWKLIALLCRGWFGDIIPQHINWQMSPPPGLWFILIVCFFLFLSEQQGGVVNSSTFNHMTEVHATANAVNPFSFGVLEWDTTGRAANREFLCADQKKSPTLLACPGEPCNQLKM